MIKAACPACGSDIEIIDTTLSIHPDAMRVLSFKIETTIKHNQFVDIECGKFLQAFAAEQRNMQIAVLERMSH